LRLALSKRPNSRCLLPLTRGWKQVQFPKHWVFYVRFEVFTAVTKKNAVFWDVTALVKTDVSEEYIASIIRMIINELAPPKVSPPCCGGGACVTL
jgi:galactose-1-phosphate uridylyltransferase